MIAEFYSLSGLALLSSRSCRVFLVSLKLQVSFLRTIAVISGNSISCDCQEINILPQKRNVVWRFLSSFISCLNNSINVLLYHSRKFLHNFKSSHASGRKFLNFVRFWKRSMSCFVSCFDNAWERSLTEVSISFSSLINAPCKLRILILSLREILFRNPSEESKKFAILLVVARSALDLRKPINNLSSPTTLFFPVCFFSSKWLPTQSDLNLFS